MDESYALVLKLALEMVPYHADVLNIILNVSFVDESCDYYS